MTAKNASRGVRFPTPRWAGRDCTLRSSARCNCALPPRCDIPPSRLPPPSSCDGTAQCSVAVRRWVMPSRPSVSMNRAEVNCVLSSVVIEFVYMPCTRKPQFVSFQRFERHSNSASCVFSVRQLGSTPPASTCLRSLLRASAGCAQCSRILLNIDLLMRWLRRPEKGTPSELLPFNRP
jgi:hypothetical protein